MRLVCATPFTSRYESVKNAMRGLAFITHPFDSNFLPGHRHAQGRLQIRPQQSQYPQRSPYPGRAAARPMRGEREAAATVADVNKDAVAPTLLPQRMMWIIAQHVRRHLNGS